MYKYQEEVVSEIDKASSTIEEMTEEHYRIHIGWRHTNVLYQENIPLFLEINGDSRFTQQTRMDESFDSYSYCELENYNRVELHDDVFLELNKLIDRVISDNKKREAFYDKLNRQLQALNMSLDTIR